MSGAVAGSGRYTAACIYCGRTFGGTAPVDPVPLAKLHLRFALGSQIGQFTIAILHHHDQK
ncbi:MAG: hypothetical protein U0X20_09340 [Caldilineaceae bacterium]